MNEQEQLKEIENLAIEKVKSAESQNDLNELRAF